MNIRHILFTLFVVAFVRCGTEATEPKARLLPPVDTVPTQTGGKEQPQTPDKDKKPADKKTPEQKTPEKKSTETSSNTDPFNQGAGMGNQSAGSFNPQMMGDMGILYARRKITVKGVQCITTQTTILQLDDCASPPNTAPTKVLIPVTQTRTILVPFATQGAFKVGDNESPLPSDRVFGFYNYYGGIQSGGGSTSSSFVPGTPQIVSFPCMCPSESFYSGSFSGCTGTILSVKTDVKTTFAAPPTINADLHREVIGFEKTFLDGRASFEVRMPYLQAVSDFGGFSGQNIGDITVVSKYAFVLDNTTGNVVSGGLALTIPTGPAVDTIDGLVDTTLIQPWFGYIQNFSNFYVQGIHAVVVPTDARNATMVFNDIGVNYWLYRGPADRFLSSIVPVAELHVTTPLNHRNPDGAIYVPDFVVFTGGIHFGIMRNTTLSLGVATPVTNPRLYQTEGFVQLNWRF